MPFAAHVEAAECPWKPEHRLVRIGLKGKRDRASSRPASNLVFLLDVSGSMDQPNKLPLRAKRGMQMLVEQLGENDRVAIVVYAGAAGLVLPIRPPAISKQTILDAHRPPASRRLDQRRRRASNWPTRRPRDHFIQGGTNRVILCTDGDFNVGITNHGDLVRLTEEKAKSRRVLSACSASAWATYNDRHDGDACRQGNGNYAYIDTEQEARKVLVEQMAGTLVTIAKDVKIQVEFNPAKVAAYRLIGYENRLLAGRGLQRRQERRRRNRRRPHA